jgi:hypothetical protein
MTADASLAAFIDTATSHDIAPDWQEDSVDPETTISAGPSGAEVGRRPRSRQMRGTIRPSSSPIRDAAA